MNTYDFLNAAAVLLAPTENEALLTSINGAIAQFRQLTLGQEVPTDLITRGNELVADASAALNQDVIQMTLNAVEKYDSSKETLPEFLYMTNFPGTIPYAKACSCANFQVRSKNYKTNKVKEPSEGASLFKVRSVQVVAPGSFVYNVAKESWCAYPKFDDNNEWLILNYMIPGSSPSQVIVCLSASTSFLNILKQEDDSSLSPRMKFLKSFWTDEQNFKKKWENRFKLFPIMQNASWIIKKSVGEQPALIGRKLTQQYHRGKNYVEIDIDLSSSSVATGILKMVRGISKTLIVDLGIALEGDSADELPEVILAQTHFNHVDLDGGARV